MKARSSSEAYLFILPILLFVTAFILYPLIYNVVTSFYDWNGLDVQKTWIGLKNYQDMLRDRVFYLILRNYVVYFFVTVFVQMALGLFFAFVIKTISLKSVSNVFKTIIFVPVVITPVVIGNVFSSTFFETNYGLINQALRALGLQALTRTWLADPTLALFSCAAVNIWQWTGFSMLLYFAGLTGIPSDVIEAAVIDGASKSRTFFSIVIPMLRSTHFSLLILGAIGVLKTFDIIYVLTKGGPNYATEFFSTYIFTTSFEQYKQGYASAYSVVLMVVALAITIYQLSLYSKRKV